jgi:hypothetical protein
MSIVQRGNVVIDVAAKVGYFLVLFSDLTGDSGEIHTFELVPSTFSLLPAKIHRFPGYKNVHLKCVVLGDKHQRTTCCFLEEITDSRRWSTSGCFVERC